jgi:hypothetical protein
MAKAAETVSTIEYAMRRLREDLMGVTTHLQEAGNLLEKEHADGKEASGQQHDGVVPHLPKEIPPKV